MDHVTAFFKEETGITIIEILLIIVDISSKEWICI